MRREMVELLPRLRRLARALTRDRNDADDLVQATLERALARAGQFRPGLRLDSWMFQIMRNAWIDELRAGQRWSRVLAPEEQARDVADTSGGPSVEAMAVRDALEELPPEQRLAVALVLVEGLSYREAADVADVPEGTITSRVARGRAALQARLGEGTSA